MIVNLQFCSQLYSSRFVAPTGQYDTTKLVNNGSNRWAFKPEFGYSQRWGHCVLDAYGAVWFFTRNPEFFSRNAIFPGIQVSIASVDRRLRRTIELYDVKRRLWFSLDSNFWVGGQTSLNGIENPKTFRKNSRVGATGSIPLTKDQSLKFGCNYGAYILYGGNYQNVSVAWQYSWLGRPN